jgi:N-acetylneuraminic acid mutarotase
MICGNLIWRNVNKFAAVRVLGLAALLSIGLAATIPFSAFAATSGTWANTGSLNTARTSHTATLLPNGQVLVAGGLNASLNPLASAELYNPATGTWSFTGSMAEARSGHTATLLQNGEVLVAGGMTTSCTSTAELYNPSTGRWATTGSMTEGRCSDTATLLPNGQVVVAGGSNSTGVLLSAELFNPATGTWKATGSLNFARYGAAAVLLPSGEALVAGGINSTGGTYSALASTEIYNPSQGQWASAESLNSTSLATTTATLLSNSDVLVVGVSGEYADPSVRTWTNTGSFPKTALVGGGHAQTLLDTSNVLVTGTRCNYSGCSHVATSDCFLYDFSTNSWSNTGSMNHARVSHAATLLPNGQMLVAGGEGANITVLGTAELYTP